MFSLSAHIFFDDAFELDDDEGINVQVNNFVKLLVETIDEAASDVHQTIIRVRPPKKYPAPYGGRLVWTVSIQNDWIIFAVKSKMIAFFFLSLSF